MAMKRSLLLVAAVLLVGGLAAPASASGAGWSITPSPNPTVPTGQLFWESCTAATSCMAVGTYVKASGVAVTLAERWDGTAWRIQPTPNPSGAAVSSLFGVSCTAPSACTAVGNSINQAGASQTLAERWNGTRWAIQPTPNPAQGGGFLASVACPSASSCTAVGVSNAGTLAERWNGTRWTIQPSPNPAGAQFFLLGVACPASSACTAAGQSINSSGTFQTLVERWNGTNWTIQHTPNPTGAASSVLGGVSCTAPSACTATGTAANRPLAERWDGVTWRIQHTPSPAGGGFLAAVSCTSAVACTAVGARTDSFGNPTGTLAERWNGTTWTIQPTPNPAGAPGTALFGVSCAASMFCMAVGTSFDSSGFPTGLVAERWDGTRWQIQPVPAPSGAPGSFFAGVSCTPPSFCTAVGARTDSAGNPVGTLAERWNGTNWSIQHTPNPPPGGVLAAVSCTTPAACTAAGNLNATPNSGTTTLAERWNGTAWTIQPTPVLSAGEGSFFSGVACQATACTAVGLNLPNSGPGMLAERWNGTSWQIQPMPTPPVAPDIDPPAVACPTFSTCTAAGGYTTVGPKVTLAEQWKGTGNSAQPTGSGLLAPGSLPAACLGAALRKPPPAGEQTPASAWHWPPAKAFSTRASATWLPPLLRCRAR